MNAKNRGETLIQVLLNDPEAFEEKEQAYDLLQAYSHGFPLETLRPLLRSQDRLVQHAAAYVVSELGRHAREVVDDVIPLLDTDDRYLRYNAMEVITDCCDGPDADKFVSVIRMLQDSDDELRVLAMRLMSNADESQLEAGARFFSTQSQHDEQHARGLSALLGGDEADPGEVPAMINDSDPLIRKYGAIAATRLLKTRPDLFAQVLASTDPEVRKMGEQVKFIKRL